MEIAKSSSKQQSYGATFLVQNINKNENLIFKTQQDS
jgi:hypothetical protein